MCISTEYAKKPLSITERGTGDPSPQPPSLPQKNLTTTLQPQAQIISVYISQVSKAKRKGGGLRKAN